MTADDDTPANRSGILTEAEMPILTKDQIELHVREGTSKFIGGDLARTCLSLFQQLAEAQAAQAELRAERDEAKRLMEMRHREMLAADKLMRKYQREAEADRVVAAALRARLAEGRVKPLVWEDYETDEGTRGVTVTTSCGRYLCVSSGWFLVGQSGWMAEPTLAAAQAAAEADYRARIAAALDVGPILALVGALEPFRLMSGELFARNWNKDDVVIALDNPGEPHRLTFGDFLELHARLAAFKEASHDRTDIRRSGGAVAEG